MRKKTQGFSVQLRNNLYRNVPFMPLRGEPE
nr:MAG TPA: hypothetical protein [Caudoviricetes sp.]